MEREAADARARELEVLADANWERAPYVAGDAASAVWNIARASACDVASRDREARQRVEQKRHLYEAELLARWHRTSLKLEIARRAGRTEEVRRHVATLLALSERSGEDAVAYRQWLRAIDGAAASALAERAREGED
jgi:hypothetical protein